MPKIFISYRREDSEYVAPQIYDRLATRFGSESVIFDVDSIPLGIDFRKFLDDQVKRCDVLLAVIGDKWLDTLKQRLKSPNDFVRIEIQSALKRDIPVVPVLVGRASMPDEDKLPPDLVELAYRNAAEVRAGADLQNHLTRLITKLDHVLSEQEAIQRANRERQDTEAEAARKAEETRRPEKETHRQAEEEKRRQAEQAEAEPGTQSSSVEKRPLATQSTRPFSTHHILPVFLKPVLTLISDKTRQVTATCGAGVGTVVVISLYWFGTLFKDVGWPPDPIRLSGVLIISLVTGGIPWAIAGLITKNNWRVIAVATLGAAVGFVAAWQGITIAGYMEWLKLDLSLIFGGGLGVILGAIGGARIMSE